LVDQGVLESDDTRKLKIADLRALCKGVLEKEAEDGTEGKE
jgi:hypothetical protein